MRKWTAGDAGPIMVKRFNEAVAKVTSERNAFVRLSGTLGGDERRSRYYRFPSPFDRPDIDAALEAIGERFDWTVTKANYKAIIEACAAALPEIEANAPIEDERDTADERARVDAIMAERNAEDKARRDQEKALLEEALKTRPSWGDALIVACLREDTSEPLSDYSGNKTRRTVAIGWRRGKREDFKQLREAAAKFPDTAHLASPEALIAWAAIVPEGPDRLRYCNHNGRIEIEHRDNYSMGRGNYLSDHGWDGGGSGWVVRSQDVGRADYLNLTEVAIGGRVSV